MTATLAPAQSGRGEVRAGSLSLVDRRVDGWLVGGGAVLAWCAMVGADAVGLAIPAFTGPVLWVLLAAIATHFAISYHLAYGAGRAALRRHPIALVVTPIALLLGVAAIVWAAVTGFRPLARSGPQLGLVAVYSLTTWHYVKQTFGVSMLGAAMGGVRVGTWARRVLRYGLYPLWFFEAATVWSHGYRVNDYGFDASFQVLPVWSVEAFRIMGLVTAAGVVAALVLLRSTSGALPMTIWSPYVAAVLWILWSPDHISTLVVLGAAHAVQYLACAHRAEVQWGRAIGETRPVVRWAGLFGGALASGMMLTYWLPMWLGYGGGTELGVTLAALVFVVLNLHHYAIDAVIWRRGEPHVRRVLS